MFLVIDNYDSFVHNLARYFELAGVETRVERNDALSVEDVREIAPEAIILSPGPCTPKEAGICVDVVKQLGAEIPILGVCLGHQAIGEAYGATTLRGEKPVHGKATEVLHDGTGVFKDLPSPLKVGRYHSLIVKGTQACPLVTTAHSDSGEVMAITHPSHPVYGVQFHPESVLTEKGQELVENFVDLARQHHKLKAKKKKKKAA